MNLAQTRLRLPHASTAFLRTPYRNHMLSSLPHIPASPYTSLQHPPPQTQHSHLSKTALRIPVAMSAIARAGARLSGVSSAFLSFARTQTTSRRNISWMAFEMPDASLYQPSPYLQPKRPLAAEAVTSTDGTTPPITMAEGIGSTPSTASARTIEDPASGKVVPASVPASAMRAGPTPLSQVQKRSFTSTRHHRVDIKPESNPAQPEPAEPQLPTPQGLGGSATYDGGFPTLRVRITGHPATWPVQEPEYPRDLREEDTD